MSDTLESPYRDGRSRVPDSADSTAQPDRGDDAERPPETPPPVIVNGRRRKPKAVLLRNLLDTPELLAPPEMVIPYVAAVGRLSMVAAREKLGKSTFAAYTAAAVSLGRELWGTDVAQGLVLWVGLEEEPGDAVRRFKALGADPDHVVLLSRLAPKNPIEQLEVEVAAYKPRLIIIDSLAACFSDVEDENGAAAWTKSLMPLVDLARKSRAAILVLHHANRAQGTYRGSSAIGASMDMIIEMTEAEANSPVRRFKPRGRWSVQPFSLRYEPSQDWVLVDGGERASQNAREERMGALGERIQVWLSSRGAPALAAEIRSAMGGKAADCDEALRRLVQEDRVRSRGPRKGYEVPGEAVDPPTDGRTSDQIDVGL